MDFVAIDVETANPSLSSICQIGLAHYRDGSLNEEWKSYIDPEDYFDEINVSIHGINENTVNGAPIFTEIIDTLYSYLDNKIVVCHTHFDRTAINQAFEKYNVRPPECSWLDSSRVARRTWVEFAWNGYGLKNICEKIGYKFKHHDALEDAKASGNILLKAILISGLDLDGWIKRVKQPIHKQSLGSEPGLLRDGNPDGPLYGEILVFTGTLQITRSEAAEMAVKIGCHVTSNVTNNTTMLVVGDQDIKKLAGHSKSIKHRKAEELILKGHLINILSESDFNKIVSIKD